MSLGKLLTRLSTVLELREKLMAKSLITPPYTPPPTIKDPAVQTSKILMRLRLMHAKGRQSTIATSPRGLLFTPENIIKRKSLLGGDDARSP